MTNSDAVHSVDRRQVTELLEAAVAELPERFRVVFMLHEVESMTVEETAEALQIPRKTVKMRLLRARRKFQQESRREALQLPARHVYLRRETIAMRSRSACLQPSKQKSAIPEWQISAAASISLPEIGSSHDQGRGKCRRGADCRDL